MVRRNRKDFVEALVVCSAECLDALVNDGCYVEVSLRVSAGYQLVAQLTGQFLLRTCAFIEHIELEGSVKDFLHRIQGAANEYFIGKL